MAAMSLQLAVLLVLLVPIFCQPCPSGCECGNVIKCKGLTSFPSFIGSKNREVNIYESTLPDIPPFAFRNVEDLTNINIYKSNIGKIRNCAFQGLQERPRYISLYDNIIDVIETGAFENITFDTEPSMSFSDSNITTIEPFAFSQLSSTRDFKMEKMNIDTIRSFAFTNFTFREFYLNDAMINTIESDAFYNFTGVGDFNFYSASVSTLHCNTLNKVRDQISDRFNVNRVSLRCDCSLAWLLTYNIDFQPSVDCFSPPELRDRAVRDLNVTLVCPARNYTQTCPRSQELPPGPCPTPTSGAPLASLSLLLLTITCTFSKSIIYAM